MGNGPPQGDFGSTRAGNALEARQSTVQSRQPSGMKTEEADGTAVIPALQCGGGLV